MDEPIIQAELADEPLRGSEAAALQPEPGPIRFSLRMMLLWMLGTAVVLSGEHSRLYMPSLLGVISLPVTSSLQLYAVISRVIAAPLLGISVAYGSEVLYKLFRKREFVVTHAGHWILCQSAVWQVCTAIAVVAFTTLGDSSPDSDSLAYWFWMAFGSLATGAIASVALVRYRITQRWRWFFAAQVASVALLILAGIYKHLPSKVLDRFEESSASSLVFLASLLASAGLSLLVATAFLVGIVGDLSDGSFRNRVHAWGVTTWCLYIALVIADSIAMSL
jgi:hypothetical protein